MIIDSSALVAILSEEVEAFTFNDMIFANSSRLLSAASYLEISIVCDNGKSPELGKELDIYLRSANIQIHPVDAEQANIAREAYRRYGKGNHEARLNFGDCFAYALSKTTGEPLLFKGDDFRKTDVRVAV